MCLEKTDSPRPAGGEVGEADRDPSSWKGVRHHSKSNGKPAEDSHKGGPALLFTTYSSLDKVLILQEGIDYLE